MTWTNDHLPTSLEQVAADFEHDAKAAFKAALHNDSILTENDEAIHLENSRFKKVFKQNDKEVAKIEYVLEINIHRRKVQVNRDNFKTLTKEELYKELIDHAAKGEKETLDIRRALFDINCIELDSEELPNYYWNGCTGIIQRPIGEIIQEIVEYTEEDDYEDFESWKHIYFQFDREIPE